MLRADHQAKSKARKSIALYENKLENYSTMFSTNMEN